MSPLNDITIVPLKNFLDWNQIFDLIQEDSSYVMVYKIFFSIWERDIMEPVQFISNHLHKEEVEWGSMLVWYSVVFNLSWQKR